MSTMHLIKKEQPTSDENKSDAISSHSELKLAIFDDKKAGLKLANNSNLSDQSFGLFRKYLCMNVQNNIGKTNEEESESIRRKAPLGPSVPPKFGDNFRPPSLLERVLFPGIKEDVKFPNLSGGEKSSTAQLTIFYSGAINVYDNVSVEKAQAIMLIAGESSSAPIVKNVSKVGIARPPPPPQTSSLPSICKLQAELPIARKHSLQRFFEKRHHRIINKSPYAPPPTST